MPSALVQGSIERSGRFPVGASVAWLRGGTIILNDGWREGIALRTSCIVVVGTQPALTKNAGKRTSSRRCKVFFHVKIAFILTSMQF